MTGTKMEGQMRFPAMPTAPPPSGVATTEPGPVVLCPGWKKHGGAPPRDMWQGGSAERLAKSSLLSAEH